MTAARPVRIPVRTGVRRTDDDDTAARRPATTGVRIEARTGDDDAAARR